MSRKSHNFEDVIRETFDGFTINPFPGTWSKIKFSITARQLLRFKPASFNVYYLGVLLTGSVIAYTTITNQKTKEVSDVGNSKPIIAENNMSDLKTGDFKFSDTETKNDKEIEVIETEEENIFEKEKNTGPSNDNRQEEKGINQAAIKDNVEGVDKGMAEVRNEEEVQEVKQKEVLPAAFLESSKDKGCINEKILFSNLSEKAIRCKWEFGDGKVSFVNNPAHVYASPGEYKVCLTIKGEDDKEYRYCRNLKISNKPLARFEVDEFNSNFDSKTVYFNNLSVNNIYNKWDFGDHKVTHEVNPRHIYDKLDAYFVKLVVKDENGCDDSTIFKISFLKAKYYIEFPNAFTPSLSGPISSYVAQGAYIDEIFYPKYKGVTEYKLYIYDRSGLVLFESSEVNYGWNGYYKSQLVSPGVYIYESSGKYENGEVFIKKGTLTVIHSLL